MDFDGVDDYLSRASFIDGLSNVTIMAWVKTDTGNTGDITIAGEDTGCKLWLTDGNRPTFTITSQGNSETSIGGCSCSVINYDEWHHITGVYNSSTGAIELYVDGELANSSNVGGTGAVIENTEDSNGNFEVGRRSTDDVANQEYFKGDIDEVRVFNSALTSAQINQIVYQEIEDDGTGTLQGSIIPKNIGSNGTCSAIPWSNLIAYYPMTDIKMGKTSDYSDNDNWLYINYITTIQDQTAPMPFRTGSDGNWTSESTWEHGDVWDIESISSNKDWCIVKIENNISTSDSHSMLGLIIDSDKTLTVNGNNYIENSWYFELNGSLDLMNDSQLIQTQTSDLVTSADGKALRRQEGTPSAYWYNYWSSPTGATGVTSLTDNNGSSNNTNNSAFTLDMVKDDTGTNFGFTSDYTASGNISSFWIFTYKNGKTYWDWERILTSADVEPGVGYTQKGTGVPFSEQQYIFEGKPNNGTILVSATDVGGPGSVQGVSKTTYLLGNPYPSALDIHTFIDDNSSVIGGTLQLWQQWSGTSHNLDEYNGGYAQVNKLGSTRAYQFVGIDGANNGSQDGTLVPSRYLPIGQGFIAEIIADGNVEFNNGQRVFILEEDADGTYSSGSVFFKGSKSKGEESTAKSTSDSNPFKKIRLEFSSVSGPDTRRELLLGFSDTTTDDYDYGYDSRCDEENNNDLNLNLEGVNMNIQAYSEITSDKSVALNFKSSGSNTFEIKISELENIEEDQEIYIKDNLTGTYYDLRQGSAYGFSSEQGKFNERFEIVFQSEQQSLSVAEASHDANFIYYVNKQRRIHVKKLSSSVTRMSLISMTGQTVMELQDVPTNVLEEGIEIPNVSTGAYVACFRTDDNQVLTKKIVVN
ncbi:LamG domain-containing protein [Seonamhaeicola sp. MEBiC1930]